MKTSSTLNALVAILLPAGLLAQPTFNTGNMPIIGDVTPIVNCSDAISEATMDGQSGANMTWDFSGLTTDFMSSFSFMDPANTPWAAEFTGATIAGVDSETNAHTYYNMNGTTLENMGYRLVTGTNDTLTLDYTDSEQIIDVPFTYMDNATDGFSGAGTAAGFAVTLDGSITYTADGHGTLILPNATYTNVIRYRMDRTETTYFAGNPTGTVTKDQWIWMSSDYRFWLLLMEKVDDGVGVDDIVWYQSSPSAAVTGVREVSEVDFSVQPNPAVANGSIRIIMDEAVSGYELIDAFGKLVRSYDNTTNELSLSGITTGVYLLRPVNRDGIPVRGKRLVVH